MSAPSDRSGLAVTRHRPGHDVRTCPACGQMIFDVAGLLEASVYCEFCGAETAISELRKPS